MSKELELTGLNAVEGVEDGGPGSGSGKYFEGEMHGLKVRVVQVYEHVNGYVKLPDGHPWLVVEDEWDIPASVHGGITYRDGDWIGFDTAHGNDIWLEFVTEEGMRYKRDATHVWTAEEMVAEVGSLAAQAAEAASPWKALGTVDLDGLA